MLWWTMRQLKADDWRAREGAVKKLGQMRDFRAVDSLLAALKDKNAHVRQAATASLVQLGEPAVRALITAAKHDPDLRPVAQEALVELGPVAVNSLGSALFDHDLALRETAAAVLGLIGGTAAIDQLLAALKHGDSGAKEAAAAGLVRVGKPAVKPLVLALKDQKARVRETAAAALVRIGPPAVEPLISILHDAEVQDAALEALTKIDPQWSKSRAARAAVPVFIEKLQHGDPPSRRAAAKLLGEIGRPEAVEPLLTAASDADENLQESAIAALGEMGDPRALVPLAGVLRRGPSRCRAAAAAALVQIGKAVVDPLINNLKDPDQNVREAAATVLVRIGHAAVQPLAEALWQIDPQFGKGTPQSAPAQFIAAAQVDPVQLVQQTKESLSKGQSRIIKAGGKRSAPPELPARSLAGTLEGARDIESLIIALDHADPQARAAAVKNLIQTATAIEEPLLAALKAGNAPTRRAAAHALAAAGDLRARETLRSELTDADPVVVLDAAEALVRLGDLNVVLGLLAVLRSLWPPSPDPGRLYHAERALRLLHRLLHAHAKDLPLEDLHAIAEFPTKEKPRFFASAAAALGEASDETAATCIVPGSNGLLDCTPLREIATRELLRRKLNG